MSPTPRACSLVLVFATVLVACSPPANPVASGNVPTAKKPDAAPHVPSVSLDPCKLVAAEEVQQVLPGAGAGMRDRADEPSGVIACVWKAGSMSLRVQAYDAPPGSVGTELQSIALGSVDIKSPQAATAVRVEPVNGAGDAALAFVEPLDDTRGIRTANAAVVVQRGYRVAVATAPSLAEGERTAGIAKLTALARAIGPRL